MNYGKKLREVRKRKNFSQEQLANHYSKKGEKNTLSNLSKAERENTNVGVLTLKCWLDRMDMSLDEYYSYCEMETNNYMEEIDEITSAYEANQTKRLVELQRYYHNKRQERRRFRLFSLLCDGYINKISNRELSKRKLSLIEEFVENLDYWYKFELVYYAGAITLFPEQNSAKRMKKIIRLYKTNHIAQHNEKYVILISLNTLYKLIESRKLDLYKDCLQSFKEFSLGKDLIFEQLRLNFIDKCYHCLIQGKNAHYVELLHSIELIKLYASKTEADFHFRFAEELFSEAKKGDIIRTYFEKTISK
ncbi:transcriptional regulator with XRE-family HTH domain [Natronobacillus azotifigens]|uniref:Helix-turn-helix transcriptional regulator n=1 Tax=Natronobacillus azotifigens TaxID=472978 RepID=A0A9J6REV1_9BACI|nr:helix-turn-helix transcriptional regulator [Natronobacillus azotifigens]MCZ0704176.1 helix-turn-helix transcriptional regulator [Natronobacillus azotifigens]